MRLAEFLARLWQEGRARWPDLDVRPEDLVRFLARHLPIEITDDAVRAALHGQELYLICAFAAGVRAAHESLEAEYMPRVRLALFRLGTGQATSDDVCQELRERLLEMGRDASARRGYSGRGSLSGWLTVCAVRMAWQRAPQKEQPLEDAQLQILPSVEKDPETALLIHRYKDSFQTAFRAALALLSSRERNLLRYHFLWKLSVDQIARIYRIHRATAARWVSGAQERLSVETRHDFLARVPLHPDSLSRVLSLLHSQLSISLSTLLADAVEAEI